MYVNASIDKATQLRINFIDPAEPGEWPSARVSDRARRFVWPMLNYLVSVFLFRPHIDDCVVSVNRCGGDAVTRFHTHT